MSYYNSREKQLDDFRIGNKSLNGREHNLLHRNEGGRFYEIGWVAGCDSILDSRGLGVGDLDGDGDEDIVVSTMHGPVQVYRNVAGSGNHWLKVRLKGLPGRNVIGSRIVVTSAAGTQIREVTCGSAYLSQGPEVVTFGLGRSDAAVTVEVHWPPLRLADGTVKREVTRREGVQVRRELVLVRP